MDTIMMKRVDASSMNGLKRRNGSARMCWLKDWKADASSMRWRNRGARLKRPSDTSSVSRLQRSIVCIVSLRELLRLQ